MIEKNEYFMIFVNCLYFYYYVLYFGEIIEKW